MPHYLSDEELRRTAPAEVASFRSPVPTQIVSNGEFNPLPRSEEHTSELQSHSDLVCRLLLEKKKKKNNTQDNRRPKRSCHIGRHAPPQSSTHYSATLC